MNLFEIIYLSVASVIVLFQAFVVPIYGCGGMENYSKLVWYEKVRKFFEQLLSSAIGFALLFYLIKKTMYIVSNEVYTLFAAADVLLLVIALLGVTGFLSLAIFKAAFNIANIFKK